MRPILHGDVVALSRLLLGARAPQRAVLCNRVITEADAADRYFKKFGRSHSLWGNGSVLSAARKRPLPPEPDLADAEYCACMEQVFRALADWRAGKSRKNV